MPRYSNQFRRPSHQDHHILDANNKKIGTLRVKPTGVAWKPASKQKSYSVSLNAFIEWITTPSTGASQTSS